MNRSVAAVVYWVPRGMSILFAAFLSLFSLDVFEEGLGFGETLLALGMHLIPVALVVAALLVAWRWEWVGAVLYAGLALAYVVLFRGAPVSWYVTIAGPLLVVAVLFLLGWSTRPRGRGRAAERPAADAART